MLDELFKAANAIKNANIVTKNWYPKFRTLPKVTAKAPCIRIWLDSDGHISDMEPISAELAVKLRKFEPDNGRSFPGFNVRPLFRKELSGTDMKTATKEHEELLKAPIVDWDYILSDVSDLWAKDTFKTVERIFTVISADLIKKCRESGKLSVGGTLWHLFKVMEKMDTAQFQLEYMEKLKTKVADGTLSLATLLYWGAVGKEQKVSVFFDIKDYIDYPVAHEKTIEQLNEMLWAGTKDNLDAEPHNSSATLTEDAYGNNIAGHNDPKMAQVSVPFLGGVFLRSQSASISAQKRYGLCEGDTFTVGDETRTGVKSALEWLSAPDRKGLTHGIAGHKELLFAYPERLTSTPPELAPLFVGVALDDERVFEDVAKKAIEQLRGIGKEVSENSIEIFTLRKMDKARTKIVYCRNTTVTSLDAASQAWGEGCKNIPSLDIRIRSEGENNKDKKLTAILEPKTPFPTQLHKHLNEVWTISRNDLKKSDVKLFEPSCGLRLMLHSPDTAQITYVLERFIAHAQSYFIFLCRLKGRGEVVKLPYLDTYPGILGLLLYKLGKTKEHYMNESAYQLGRFLRVADEIHRLYCEIVRNKEIPPELCGSSMLVAMLENPTQALAQLCARSAPYVKWARAYHGEEKGGLVHYWMHKWSPIADKLYATSWPQRPTSEQRAQIFLGYLSSFSKTETPESVTEPLEGEQQ